MPPFVNAARWFPAKRVRYDVDMRNLRKGGRVVESDRFVGADAVGLVELKIQHARLSLAKCDLPGPDELAVKRIMVRHALLDTLA